MTNDKITPCWYAARLILKCSVGNQQSAFLIDEQIRIINAADPEEAYEKALNIGKREEHEYLNSDGESVKWLFAGLFDLDEIDSLGDEAEISSKRIWADSVDDLVVSKSRLTVFWKRDNINRTAQEILDEIDE